MDILYKEWSLLIVFLWVLSEQYSLSWKSLPPVFPLPFLSLIQFQSIPIHSNWGSQRIDFIASLVNYLHQLPLLFAMAIPNSIIPLTSVADLDLSDPPHLPGSGSNTNNLHVTGSTPKRITTNHTSWLRIRTVCLDPDCNPS